MKRKRRKTSDEDSAELLSRELGWIEASRRHSTQIIFGAPMRCPSDGCGDFGLVESVDRGRQHNRCWSCGTCWTLSTHALALFAQTLREPTGPTIVGAGTLVAELDAPDAARTTRERFVGVFRADSPSVRYLPH